MLFSPFANRSGRLLAVINRSEPDLRELGSGQLRKSCLALKYRARTGEPLLRLLPDAYALVREAARRTLNMRHFDVQIIGGIALHMRSVAEMQTGEGKTLTATLPLTLAAMAGKGAHLATVNDYLARRDAEWMRPVYEFLGLSVGVVESSSSPSDRHQAYACDVTYGTAKEFGFDFLRDRLAARLAADADGKVGSVVGGLLPAARPTHEPTAVQRQHYFALIDEVDSVLIDEAGTPLILSTASGDSQAREVEAYRFAALAAGHLIEDQHFQYDPDAKTAHLTPAGQRLSRSLKQPDTVRCLGLKKLYEFIERAIRVQRDFHRDQQYVVRNGQVVVVDEFSGRLSEGRKWRHGIHQAIEAREGLKVTIDAGPAAQITVQNYFQRYQHLAGMTGTAAGSGAEFKRIYNLSVRTVPTSKPPIRKQLPTMLFATSHAKWLAVVTEVEAMHRAGRPVLVGTRSIEKSELLADLLKEAGIKHQVLNARHVAAEAEIIALAGQPGRVTVSTNMAGRGTDIQLGAGVAELGGLHVIATEMHEAERVDRQLVGRCGRQGDPGSFRQYVALDDELLVAGLGPDAARSLLAAYSDRELPVPARILRRFRRAQRIVEQRQFRLRKTLLYQDRRRNESELAMGHDPYLDALT